MSAEDPVYAMFPGISQSSLLHLAAEPQPAGICPVDKTAQTFTAWIHALHLQEKHFTQTAQKGVTSCELVELMAVNCQMGNPSIVPAIVLVNRDSNQMRHQLGEAQVVITLHPDHLDLALGIREFADVRKKVPVLLFEAAEVQIAEDVPQQNQPAELDGFKQTKSGIRPAELRSQVKVGDDDGIKT